MAAASIGVAAALAIAAEGCVMTPNTGDTFNYITNAGHQIQFNGRSDTPNKPVIAYVLDHANPAADPLNFSHYVSVTGSGNFTGTTPYPGNDTVPYYTWSFLSTPLTATQWPQGGLARFLVQSPFNGSSSYGDMIVFDNQGMDCLVGKQGDPWRQAGYDCAVTTGAHDSIITVVSTYPTPSWFYAGNVPYLDRGGDHRNHSSIPSDHEDDTNAYYTAIDAPGWLADFKLRYRFPSPTVSTTETRAIYYNRGDLGIGRDMHCRKHTPRGKPTVVACYVTNYGRSGGMGFPPDFGAYTMTEQEVLDQTIESVGYTDAGDPLPSTRLQPVATVAMVYDPSFPPENQVQFMVYDRLGKLDPYAALDSHGVTSYEAKGTATKSNITVPDNCLACHGISSVYTRADVNTAPGIVDATFLPFDEESMVFAAGHSSWQKSLMVPRLKELNKLVWDTNPTAGVIELLQGMYDNVNGPHDGSATFHPEYVPAGWDTTDTAKRVYTEVVKPYCRTCHVSALPASGLDFASFYDFAGVPGIEDVVCTGLGPMPNAEQTQTLFWESPARAYLSNALGFSSACTPPVYP